VEVGKDGNVSISGVFQTCITDLLPMALQPAKFVLQAEGRRVLVEQERRSVLEPSN